MFQFSSSVKEGSVEADEIRQLQKQRSESQGVGLSSIGLAFDKDLYGTRDSTNYLTELDTLDSKGNNKDTQQEEDEDEDEERASRSRFLNSWQAPRELLEDLRETPDDYDPFKDTKKLTIAEREDEYRARWRKRKLSPPRMDAFSGKPDERAVKNTYKDIMEHALLDKERAEVVRKIEEQEKQKREDRAREQRKEERERSERHKELKKKKESSGSKSTSPKRARTERQWKLQVKKNEHILPSIELDGATTYSVGRGPEADIRLEHQSISKNHAKICFRGGIPNIMDLNSTNSTTLNKQELEGGTWHKLSVGDIVCFGCSSREYIVICD